MDDAASGDFDAFMAQLRADADDVAVLFDVLRQKLSDSLGSRVRYTEERARRHREATSTLTLMLGDHEFEATLRAGAVTAVDRHRVRGITLRSDELELDEWIRAVVTALRDEASRSEATRTALERLLSG